MRRAPASASAPASAPISSRLAVLAALAVLVPLTLTGCQAAEDAAQDAASDAACSAARSTADEAGRQAGQAVDDIGADPAAAERELRSIRDTLAGAQNLVSGETRDRLIAAKDAVEKLLGQAQDAVQGAEVDTSTVTDAKGELDRAVEDVKNLC